MNLAELKLEEPLTLSTVEDVVDLLNGLDGCGIVFTDEDLVLEYFGFTPVPNSGTQIDL